MNLENFVTAAHHRGFSFMVFLDPLGVPFHLATVFGFGPDFLSKSILKHYDRNFQPFWPYQFHVVKLYNFYWWRPNLNQTILRPPLSGENIWINHLTQKRYTMHIDGCDIWNDLRQFSNFLVHPFSSKVRSKEAKGLKSGNLGKQNFFLNINFLLDSILFLRTMVNFHLKVA